MGLSVTFVSGPRGAGKSAVIRTMIDRLWRRPPHYIRLVTKGGDKQPPASCQTRTTQQTQQNCGVASARWLEYDPSRVFQALPEALNKIHATDRFGGVVVEADADPCLRNAYPYDHRLFVMPTPTDLREIFRTPTEAAKELRGVLDDTASFASEIFGLFDDRSTYDEEPHEVRAELSDTQMRGFLYSPLGDELATRIQLQPPYHGLLESDVILINTRPGGQAANDECIRRIHRLLDRIQNGHRTRRTQLFNCDPRQPDDAECRNLYEALTPMCRGGY